MRLIDADAFKIKGVSEESLEFDAGVIYVLDCLANAPTVDAEPVRHGKWIEPKTIVVTDQVSECSECGYPNDVWGWKYCPWCGARMDGVSE